MEGGGGGGGEVAHTVNLHTKASVFFFVCLLITMNFLVSSCQYLHIQMSFEALRIFRMSFDQIFILSVFTKVRASMRKMSLTPLGRLLVVMKAFY